MHQVLQQELEDWGGSFEANESDHRVAVYGYDPELDCMYDDFVYFDEMYLQELTDDFLSDLFGIPVDHGKQLDFDPFYHSPF